MYRTFLLILVLVIPLRNAWAQVYPPPQNLYGLWVCDSTHVRWDPPDSGDVTGYHIYRLEVEGGEWLFQGWVSSDTDSFVVQGDPPFCYGLTALYKGGESERADVCEFDILDVFTFPPDRVDAVATGDTIRLNWSSGQFGCGVPVGYDIFREPEGGLWTWIASVPPDSLSYLDPNLDEGTWCYYVRIVSTGGEASSSEACATVELAGISGVSATRPNPLRCSLRQNSPNPFNPSTTISFDIPGESGRIKPVDLTVYDLRGRRIHRLIDSALRPGSHTIHWNGRDDSGGLVPSGIYFYCLKVGDEVHVRKMTLVE